MWINLWLWIVDIFMSMKVGILRLWWICFWNVMLRVFCYRVLLYFVVWIRELFLFFIVNFYLSVGFVCVVLLGNEIVLLMIILVFIILRCIFWKVVIRSFFFSIWIFVNFRIIGLWIMRFLRMSWRFFVLRFVVGLGSGVGGSFVVGCRISEGLY